MMYLSSTCSFHNNENSHPNKHKSAVCVFLTSHHIHGAITNHQQFKDSFHGSSGIKSGIFLLISLFFVSVKKFSLQQRAFFLFIEPIKCRNV